MRTEKSASGLESHSPPTIRSSAYRKTRTVGKFAFPSASAGTGAGWILQCAWFREPIAQHCGTKQKAPGGLRWGLLLL